MISAPLPGATQMLLPSLLVDQSKINLIVVPNLIADGIKERLLHLMMSQLLDNQQDRTSATHQAMLSGRIKLLTVSQR
jgi:hypothetical protein